MSCNRVFHNKGVKNLIEDIAQWHYDRNLILGSTDEKQLEKLREEVAELEHSIYAGKDIRDDVGDIIVVLVGMLERNNLSLQDALEQAWGDIKDRKGAIVNGVFVKEPDMIGVDGTVGLFYD